MNDVICSFDLFEFTEVDGMVLISSPYLDRVMEAYDTAFRSEEKPFQHWASRAEKLSFGQNETSFAGK